MYYTLPISIMRMRRMLIMGLVMLRVQVYYETGYGRTTTTATGVLRLRLRAYYDCGYGRMYGRTTLTFLLHIRTIRRMTPGCITQKKHECIRVLNTNQESCA